MGMITKVIRTVGKFEKKRKTKAADGRRSASRKMGTAKTHRSAKPRSLGGGRSSRYESRHAQRRSATRYAPGWSDAAAHAVYDSLHTEADNNKCKIGKHTLQVMCDASAVARLARAVRGVLGTSDSALAQTILDHYHTVISALNHAGNNQTAKKKVHALLKTLRERRASRAAENALIVQPKAGARGTFHRWLATDTSRERLRDIGKSTRILKGIAHWDLSWMDTAGVICYERAAERVASERPRCRGKPEAAFVRGLVKTIELPTAVANASDHYVLLEPGKPARFLTVEEVARTTNHCG